MITLVLPYPVSANRYWATRTVRVRATGKSMTMTYVTPEAVEYKAEVAKRAKLAGLRIPVDGRVLLTLGLYPQRPKDWAKRSQNDPDFWDDDVRCLDLGNCEKVMEDALNGVAWIDDKQVFKTIKERHEPDELGARLVATIQPYVRARVAPDLFAAA